MILPREPYEPCTRKASEMSHGTEWKPHLWEVRERIAEIEAERGPDAELSLDESISMLGDLRAALNIIGADPASMI